MPNSHTPSEVHILGFKLKQLDPLTVKLLMDWFLIRITFRIMWMGKEPNDRQQITEKIHPFKIARSFDRAGPNSARFD